TLRRLEDDLDPADRLHARQRAGRVALHLSHGPYRPVGSLETAARSLWSLARTVCDFLRATSDQLSGFKTHLQRGRYRNSSNEHDPRHAARELHVDRVSRGVFLLQLATHTGFAGDRACYRCADGEVWTSFAQPRTREF